MEGDFARGVCITDSSTWMLDGTGRYRRTPRAVARVGDCVDNGLDYGDWITCQHIGLESTDDGLRLRVVPASRPVDAHGILSGVIVWTNLVVDGEWDRFGPADPWFPHSPVPADRDLWPGELPFTAFGQFGPDALDLRVFDQGSYWVDRNGVGHRIDEMAHDYVTNVLAMLLDRAEEFHGSTMLRSAFQMIGDTMLGRANGELLVGEIGIGAIERVESAVWLRSTPLFRSLVARLAASC